VLCRIRKDLQDSARRLGPVRKRSGDEALPQSTGAKLLIIESDDPFRRKISVRLRQENYRVFEACQEIEAHRIMQRKDIDVILLGLRGLKQRGLSLLKAIKEERPSIEVILLIPSEELSLSIEGMKLGAFDDLMVPFDLETLLERIQAACLHKAEKAKEKK
jgi:DNA-binding NtrC family response regulator